MGKAAGLQAALRLGGYYAERQVWDQAQNYMEEVIRTAELQGNRDLANRQRLFLGQLFLQINRADDARKQFETAAAQTKELAALAHKVATDTAEPVKESVTKAFKKVA